MKYLSNTLIQQILAFASGGALIFFLKIILTAFLTEYISIPYIVSYSITLIISILFSFFYHIYVTFKINKPSLSYFLRFIIALLFFYLVDALLVWNITEFLKIHYTLSITITTIILFFIKFIVFDKLVFYKSKMNE